jgi:hypothetical protein
MKPALSWKKFIDQISPVFIALPRSVRALGARQTRRHLGLMAGQPAAAPGRMRRVGYQASPAGDLVERMLDQYLIDTRTTPQKVCHMGTTPDRAW